MAVPDRAVGAIIGKGGEVISQIKSVVGVRIRISSRDEYIEGTKDRSVTITGHPPPAPPPPPRPPARSPAQNQSHTADQHCRLHPLLLQGFSSCQIEQARVTGLSMIRCFMLATDCSSCSLMHSSSLTMVEKAAAAKLCNCYPV